MLGKVKRVVGGRRVERKEWSYRGHSGVLAVKDKVTGWVKSDDVDVSCVCLQWRTVSYTYIIHRGEGGTEAQGTHSNHIFKFPVFSLFISCPTANFPCANLRCL